MCVKIVMWSFEFIIIFIQVILLGVIRFVPVLVFPLNHLLVIGASLGRALSDLSLLAADVTAAASVQKVLVHVALRKYVL